MTAGTQTQPLPRKAFVSELLGRSDYAIIGEIVEPRTKVLDLGCGEGELLEWLAARHDVDPSRIFVTNGSLQGFVFLAQRLAPGRRVLVERPTYDRPLKILRELGAEIVPVACDDEATAVRILDAEERLIRGLLGDVVFGIDEQSMETVVLDLLRHDPRSLPSRVEIRPSKPRK